MFLKIFLWFCFAVALIIGVLMLVTWTTQGEPSVRQWQIVVGNTVGVYAATTKQIYENEGDAGVRRFLQTLESSDQIEAVCLWNERQNNQCSGELAGEQAAGVIEKARTSDETELETLSPEENYVARRFAVGGNENFVLALRWKRPQTAPPATDARVRWLRILAGILTAGLVCYALALYLVSPILKLRKATQKFASGDLQTRVATKRRDELGSLARDFDEMAERIENLIAAQNRLTSDISHELRSPLARLGVALEIARTKSSGEAQSALDRIEREAARLNELIGQLLTLSKLETGEKIFEQTRVDLSKLLTEIVADADFEAKGKNKSVKIAASEKVFVGGNANLLRSAIENVVRNAVKYAPEGTNVEVSLASQIAGNAKKQIVLIVRDYGAGVPAEDLDKIFRPFFRISQARERGAGGTGLGLAITKRAIAAHDGGSVRAENADGGGLIVTLKLNAES